MTTIKIVNGSLENVKTVNHDLQFESVDDFKLFAKDTFNLIDQKPLNEEVETIIGKVDSNEYFNETEDTICIRTNYKNPFEFRISYSGSNAPSIINKQNVLRQRGNDIYLSSVVEVKKDTPFSVYFEVNSPRSGSWLVFKNH
jgi:hypothetical protein